MAPKRRKAQSTEGETSNPSPQREIQVRIDPDLLDCPICFRPLCSPVNQCTNGHVACRTCWTKLKHKCHTCKAPVVSFCIALDKILDSVHVPCTYAHFGCCKYVSYSQRQVHTDTCEFGPFVCPIPGCAHKASSGEWQKHFLKDHLDACCHTYYSYGQQRKVLFKEEDLYYTLIGPSEDLFLLVKEPILNVGHALFLYYVDLPHHRGQNVFPYELKVVTRENCITSSVQLNSQAVSIKKWKRGEVRGTYLMVPLGSTDKNMEVYVCL